jgi:hypothetical protein
LHFLGAFSVVGGDAFTFFGLGVGTTTSVMLTVPYGAM